MPPMLCGLSEENRTPDFVIPNHVPYHLATPRYWRGARDSNPEHLSMTAVFKTAALPVRLTPRGAGRSARPAHLPFDSHAQAFYRRRHPFAACPCVEGSGAICYHIYPWSWRQESNPQLAEYKTATLPLSHASIGGSSRIRTLDYAVMSCGL